MEEKDIALVKMKEALEHLRKSWIECNNAFADGYATCNDYILGSVETEDQYPFHMSFDELNVVNWIDGCLERIEKDIKCEEHDLEEICPHCSHVNKLKWDRISRRIKCQNCGEEILLCSLCDMDEVECSKCPYENE